MRTPTIPWETEKAKLLDFRQRGFSYKKISEYLYATYGRTVTQARLSQVFNGWKEQSVRQESEQEAFECATGSVINAN